jgi:hypothetical protein
VGISAVVEVAAETNKSNAVTAVVSKSGPGASIEAEEGVKNENGSSNGERLVNEGKRYFD